MFPYCLVSVLGTLSHSATSIGNRNLPENAEIYSLENEPWHEISNNLVCVTSKGSDQPGHTRSDQSLYLSLENALSVKLLTEHRLRFLSIKGGCTGLSESILVKISHCWSHMSWLKSKIHAFPSCPYLN